MHATWQLLYSLLLLPLFRFGVRLGAKKNQKLAQTLAGHDDLWSRLEQQLSQAGNTPSPIWFHVASAGEYLQALPVMQRLMDAGYPCVLTVTSVSGYRWAMKAKRHPKLIAVDYLPFDTRANIKRLLRMIQPQAVVYVKFDLWPNLIWLAHAQGIPQFLISATLQEKSKRFTSRLGRSLYRSLYACLDGIYTVSEGDSARFRQTCPGHNNILTVGDTRFDSVLDRRDQLQPPDLPGFFRQQPVLVLGSIWPQDEAILMPVISQAMAQFAELVIIAAPHEVDEKHLRDIEQALSGQSLVRFSQLNQARQPFRVLLVDSVGQLSALYHYADIAYVGGAFGKGVHNTMEPSAMGAPAVFGPFYQNSPEAMELVTAKKAFTIHDEAELKRILFDLLDNAEYRLAAGRDAARYIEQQAGASDICFAKIKEALS